MILVDTHCHLDRLDLAVYQNNLDLALSAAKTHGVRYILCVCIDLEHFPDVLRIAEQCDNVYATVGLHPNDKVDVEPTAAELIKLANHPKVIGIGETGLDYYRSEGDLDWQRQRFREHIHAAKATHKPIIVHTRDAKEDTTKILREEGAEQVGGIMHCFTETWDIAKQALDLNFYISFSGIITFRNAEAIREVAQKVPLDRLLIETDAPYLAPVPYRGKPNEPAYVRYVAAQLAELRGMSVTEMAAITTRNFAELFKLKLNVE